MTAGFPNARYGHTNLVARDWRVLASFYERVFGCVPVPPERDYSGSELEAGTGVPGTTVRGVHLRLPGLGPDGPTLEIYTYSVAAEPVRPEVNRPGFGHVAFVVADVAAARGFFFVLLGHLYGLPFLPVVLAANLLLFRAPLAAAAPPSRTAPRP